MAKIGARYLMQQIAGKVVLFERYSENVLVEFNPSMPSDIREATKRISAHSDLSTNEKAEAHFWSGYFYAHANM